MIKTLFKEKKMSFLRYNLQDIIDKRGVAHKSEGILNAFKCS